MVQHQQDRLKHCKMNNPSHCDRAQAVKGSIRKEIQKITLSKKNAKRAFFFLFSAVGTVSAFFTTS
jgi:hypothetical protein